MDVPKALICIEFAIQNSNPISLVQGMGRIGRDAHHEKAFLYRLLTRQSDEVKRLEFAKIRISTMKKSTKKEGTSLYLITSSHLHNPERR